MGDVSIRLESTDLNNTLVSALIPTSVTVHYGINSIPYVELSINPIADGVTGDTFIQICNFDKIYRRKQLSVIISTHVIAGNRDQNVCLRFDGIIDGLSFSQSPGGLTTQLVVKHKMQWLTEVAPKIVGIHPSSVDVFQLPAALDWQRDPATGDIILSRTLSGAGPPGLDNTGNIIDWYVGLLRAAVTSQKEVTLSVEENASEYLALGSILKSQDIYKENGLADTVLDLIDSIDTSAIQGLPFKAGMAYLTGFIADTLVSMRDNIFANLVRFSAEMGCCVVVGRQKTFIVPEAAYLNVPKPGTPALRQVSSLNNTILPSEFENFTFNDNGFVNIKGVYIVHDPNTNQYATLQINNTDYGVFVDTDPEARGNIVFTHLPQYASIGLANAIDGGEGTQQVLGGAKQNDPNNPLLAGQLKLEDAVDSAIKMSDNALVAQSRIRTFMDAWAQMAYCKMKYDDRTGSFNAVYNNAWAPGAMGYLYTRLPGIYCDFFVTGVTHNFQLNIPNGGSIVTTVSFKGGRLGPTANTGLPKVALYDYSWTNAQQFTNMFLDDVRG